MYVPAWRITHSARLFAPMGYLAAAAEKARVFSIHYLLHTTTALDTSRKPMGTHSNVWLRLIAIRLRGKEIKKSDDVIIIIYYQLRSRMI